MTKIRGDSLERAFLALARWHRDQWQDTDPEYWLHRMMQEVGELAGVLANDHDDSMECEALQIASIALNMVARFGDVSEVRHELVKRLGMTPNEASAFILQDLDICTICDEPIQSDEAFVGTGDGTGKSFAHLECWRAERDG